jgi:hypothetical protein
VTSTASAPPVELLLRLLRGGPDGLAVVADILEEHGATGHGLDRLREALGRPSRHRQGVGRLAEALAVQAGLLPLDRTVYHTQAAVFYDGLEAIPLADLPALNVAPDLPAATLARLVRAIFRELGLVGAHVRASRRKTGMGAGVVAVRLPVVLGGDHSECVQAVDAILARTLPGHRERVLLL